ncbi:MAG: hypothetical protein JW860_09230 [Sedimentisphaerales bacterium]|nr:hypothetical protein [Sedimentisphaerales bacterium]
MKKKGCFNASVKKISMALIWIMALSVLLASGCQKAPLAGEETYRKEAFVWPVFDFEKTRGINEDGTTWEKEKGDACFWLASWEKERRYDKDNFLIYRKERSGIFPFCSDEEVEDMEFSEHRGSVLIFPFYSKKSKTDQLSE